MDGTPEWDAAQAKRLQMRERLSTLEGEAYAKPAVTMADVQTRATLAAYWGCNGDGTDTVEIGHGPIEWLDSDSADAYEHALARLLEAVLQVGGRRGAGAAVAPHMNRPPEEIAPAGLPPLADVEAAIAARAEEDVADGEPVTWDPLPVSFDYTNEEFAAFLRVAHMAVVTLQKDHHAVRDVMRELLKDENSKDVIAALFYNWTLPRTSLPTCRN
jgi:hypothetical protein